MIVLCARASAATADEPPTAWREAYESSPANYEPVSRETLEKIAEAIHQPLAKLLTFLPSAPVQGTFRYQIHLVARGTQLRIRLSNELRSDPLSITAASVGVLSDGFSAQPGSLRPITFGGSGKISIAAGAPAISDPVGITVRPGADLVVSVRVANPLQLEGRGGARVAVAPDDQTLAEHLQNATEMDARPLVTGVMVEAPARSKVVVALGDSITDGNRGTPNALHGWPEEFALRLAKRRTGGTYTVANAGIAGNRLLQGGWGDAALARLDRDVFRIGGLSHLIVLEGINDIGMSGKTVFGDNPDVTATDLISAYRQIIARAHARGVKVGMATLTPFVGANYATPAKEQIRAAVNRWIRESREPDFVLDFARVLADSTSPQTLRKEYDSGDHLHPSDAGHRAMGDSIDLSLFP